MQAGTSGSANGTVRASATLGAVAEPVTSTTVVRPDFTRNPMAARSAVGGIALPAGEPTRAMLLQRRQEELGTLTVSQAPQQTLLGRPAHALHHIAACRNGVAQLRRRLAGREAAVEEHALPDHVGERLSGRDRRVAGHHAVDACLRGERVTQLAPLLITRGRGS